MSELARTDTRIIITRQFMRGLRIGMLVIPLGIFASVSIVRNRQLYDPFWPQAVAYAFLFTIVVIELVLVIRDRPWTSARWIALAGVMCAYILSCATLREGFANTSPDWAFGTVGWVALILLLDKPLKYLIWFLATHEAITVVNLLLDHGGRDELLNLVSGSLGTIGFPLATGIAAGALHHVSRIAADSIDEEADATDSRVIAAQSAARRRQAFTDLDQTLIPLLEDIANGRADIGEEDVQRRSKLEASRSRRFLVSNEDSMLMGELRQRARAAELVGVFVEIDDLGQWKDPPQEICTVLGDVVSVVLAGARRFASIVVLEEKGALTITVTADRGSADTLDDIVSSELRIESGFDEEGGTLWVEVRWGRPVQSSQ